MNRENMPIISVPDGTEDQLIDNIEGDVPVLVLRNTVLFPGNVIPITVGRPKSVKAVKAAEEADGYIAVVSQKDIAVEDPAYADVYKIGVLGKIVKILDMPDGNLTVIIQGRSKYKLSGFTQAIPYLRADIKILPKDKAVDDAMFSHDVAQVREMAKSIIELTPTIPNEAIMMLKDIKDDKFLINFIASNMSSLTLSNRQTILKESNLNNKCQKLMTFMLKELQQLEIKHEVESKVRGTIDQQQKEYFLNQQLRTIQDELGQNPQAEEFQKLEERAQTKDWSDEVKDIFFKQLNKAKRLNPAIAEYSVQLNYLELMLDLPWNEVSEDNIDLKKVKARLDKDHFGLDKVKDRIIEHLSVLKLKGDMKAPILCLVGPPGVGKTSLGKSIADAIGREFVRMSLGGLHDESELRGHRKTYIGAMPGRVINSIKKAKVSNPVFILDEIDKLGKNHKGDPSSALLEILDPEQNETFHDNYLDVDYDLSKVLFIATANSLQTIQPALRDRMEIIQLSGYTVEEKIEIAKKHLVPKSIEAHGLKKKDVSLGKTTIKKIVESYTREAGVRSLYRQIGGVMRSIAKKVALEEEYDKKLTPSDVVDILGPEKVNPDKYKKINVPGVVTGLAWTAVGGDILFIEASKSAGKGKLQLTGNLGDVMKESATTALSYVRAHAEALGIDPEIFDKTDLHIHVPEGAVPKDGPSAGITMLTAITSILTGKKVKERIAMTGEISLRGQVLPVGGIKEKILAAKRAGIITILLCEENRRHIEEIEDVYLKGLNFIFVDKMMDVIKHAIG